MKIQKIQIVLAVLCAASACACYGYGRYRAPDRESAELTVKTESLEKMAGLPKPGESEPGETAAPAVETRPPCYVHICGEVKSPGVYELAAESRVFAAVEAAGGLTEEAAEEYLNLAETVSDGMKIAVPSRQEIEAAAADGGFSAGTGGSPAGKQNKRINLNSASKEELMTLRGIGQARAEDIIRYREERGGFGKIEDIMKISGIKEAAFSKIKDDITV